MARLVALLCLLAGLVTLARPLRAQSVPSRPDPTVHVTGYFCVTWSDGVNGSDTVSYSLMDGHNDPVRLELPDALRRSLGRVSALAGKQVAVAGDYDASVGLVLQTLSPLPERRAGV